MKDKDKTKEQLINELAGLRQRTDAMEKIIARSGRVEGSEWELLYELKSVFENIPFGIVYLDNNFRIISSNRYFNDFTGFREGELSGRLCYEIVGEYSDDPIKNGPEKICSFCKKDECFTSKKPTVIERPLNGKFIKVTTIPELDESGEIWRFLEIVEDITERKKVKDEIEKAKDMLELMVDERTADLEHTNVLMSKEIVERMKAEKQIMAALEEKEVLLQEIHHRVKNNMTVIHSLLELQSRNVEDVQYKEMFRESMARIKSMALIHEDFYQSRDLANINFGDYLDRLTDRMYLSYELQHDKVKLNKDIEQVTLGIDTAIPCGLIVNELFSNSLKYAFPDEREGEIRVALSMKDKKEVELTVGDNGVGMPEDMDYKTTRSLGLNLVNALVTQLRGRLEMQTKQGTEFKISFRSN
ncbi:MAG: PAS domain-containing protein [Nitrospira sp.]|nr:PAS domain-containing protein [Nitrospira sp.]